MQLENIVIDAHDPRQLGRFYAELLGAEQITNEPDCYEARLWFGEHFFMDLCFPRVTPPSTAPVRLHLDLVGGEQQTEVVRRAQGLGAREADIGQGDVAWTVLADPEGNTFCVLEEREHYDSTSPIACLPLLSSDPRRDAALWAEISGWVPFEGYAPESLRHPSGHGPLLELCHESQPKRDKNRMHLDTRAQGDDADALDRLIALGATKAESQPDDVPWVVFNDPSGNEFCVLAPRRALARFNQTPHIRGLTGVLCGVVDDAY